MHGRRSNGWFSSTDGWFSSADGWFSSAETEASPKGEEGGGLTPISTLLLVIGLGFALLGQFYFFCRREYVWDGVFLWSVALFSLGLFLWRVDRKAHGRRRPGQRWALWLCQGGSPRALALIGGAWFVGLSGWLARRWPERADFSAPLWLWGIGVVSSLLAFMPFRWKETRWCCVSSAVRWVRARRFELAGLVVLLAAALALRLVDLEHVPANLGGDEGTQGVAALRLLGPPLGNPFSTGWFSVPTMSFLAWGLSMRVFGETVAGLRTLSALIGTLTVLTTFLLARELWGRGVGWLAASLLAFSHFHIHFSRLGSNQIADGLCVTLALWLLARGLRSRRAIYFALAGAVTGMGWYGYFGARLVGIVLVSYCAWRLVVQVRFLSRYGRLLLVLVWAALVVAAPLLFHYVEHPEAMVSRARQVSIFASGWLAREREITGRSTAALMLQQLWKSVSAFNYTLDPTYWYHPSIPLLDFVSGLLFVIGLFWATARWRWPANGLLLLWFWLAVVLGWVVTENPPSSMRLTIVAPALAALVGLGLKWLVAWARRMFGGGRVLWGLVLALLAAIAALNLHYYFAVYTPTRVYGNPSAEVATELGRYLAQQDDGYIVYFYGPPFMYWGHGTLRFMAGDVVGQDVPQAGESSQAEEPDPRRGARFVFLSERLGELGLIRTRYPGGVEVPVRSDVDGRLLYVSYEVAP